MESIGSKVERMMNNRIEGIIKSKDRYAQRQLKKLKDEIVRLENICKKNNLAYKKPAKKRPARYDKLGNII
jgi:hypothetical protein